MKPLYPVMFALTACAADPAAPFVVTDHLAMPADLQVSGELLYSIQYDGSVIALSTVDRSVTTIVPAQRQVAADEISIDLDTYGVAVTGNAMYWTEQVHSTPTVHRAELDGSNATVVATDLTRLHALIATADGACWSSATAITCAHGTTVTPLALGLAEPRAMASDGTTLYFAQPSSPNGDGGLFAVALSGGPVQTLATGLDDPRALALIDQRVVWVDGGSRTCTQGLCTPNHDAALHSLAFAPGSVALVISSAYASVDSGLAVDGTATYFVAEARMRARDMAGVQNPGSDTLVSHATEGCTALAVADGLLYCADSDKITAIDVAN